MLFSSPVLHKTSVPAFKTPPASRNIHCSLSTAAQPSLAAILRSSPRDAWLGPAQTTVSLHAALSLTQVKKPAHATASCLEETTYKLCSASSAGSAVTAHLG